IPDRKIDDGADDESARVQISVLDEVMLLKMLFDVRIPDRIERHEPGIVAMLQHTDDDRNKKDSHHRQCAHGGAENEANDRSPSAAGEVADHDNGHGAERDAEPIHVAEQISAIELVRTQKCERDRTDGEHHADDQRALTDRLYS